MKKRFYKGYTLTFAYTLGTWTVSFHSDITGIQIPVSLGHYTLGQCVRHIDKHYRPYPQHWHENFDRKGNSV